jgi:hypothetical protein
VGLTPQVVGGIHESFNPRKFRVLDFFTQMGLLTGEIRVNIELRTSGTRHLTIVLPSKRRNFYFVHAAKTFVLVIFPCSPKIQRL